MAFEMIMVALSTIFIIAAIFFSIMLSRETKGEKYWIFFVFSALGFGLSHLSGKLGQNFFGLQEAGEIIGAFSLAYACYGLYTSMKKIREKVGKELGD